jgi:N-acetylgalactosamine kinase
MSSSTTTPVVNNIQDIYSTNISEQQERYQQLGNKFEQVFSHKPQFYARAPGRVNLIGEHVDYSGYGVLPMALEVDAVVACSTTQQQHSQTTIQVNIRHAREEKFDARDYTFDISTGDANPIKIDSSNHHWTNYVLCGVKAGFDVAKKVNGGVVLNFVIDGTVPMGSGLSSSSALVCAATLTTCRALNVHESVTRQQLGQLAADAERFGMSVQIGGMDQAISFLGEKNHAQYITFEPKLDNKKVTLPDGVSFVVAHTLVGAHKNESAAHNYNRRVIECRLATAILSKHLLNETLSGYQTLHWLQEDKLHESLENMIEYTKKYLTRDSYDLEHVTSELNIDEAELKRRYYGSITLATEKDFKLRQRALHVFSESKRVLDAVKLSSHHDESSAQKFGDLMNESHYSCRDLFECSCAELEQLTGAARQVDGCLGSRLTGAGWGGCCVSLVRNDAVSKFTDTIWNKYYESMENKESIVRSEVLFASQPASGAAVYEPSN